MGAQEASRVAPVPGSMVDPVTREAMADPGTQEAMADTGTREAMAEQGAWSAIAEQGTREAMVGSPLSPHPQLPPRHQRPEPYYCPKKILGERRVSIRLACRKSGLLGALGECRPEQRENGGIIESRRLLSPRRKNRNNKNTFQKRKTKQGKKALLTFCFSVGCSVTLLRGKERRRQGDTSNIISLLPKYSENST